MSTRKQPAEFRLLARQRSEVAVLWWIAGSGWHYSPQSDSHPDRRWSAARCTQEEIVALAFECGFGAVRLPDGTMIKRTKETT